jgi:hypothetical protein
LSQSLEEAFFRLAGQPYDLPAEEAH